MFSSNLALDYMTRASSIKENYFLEPSDEKQFEKIMNEMNQLEYKKNVADVTSGLRKRGSILKAPGSSGNEKKKVHWPENLPRYTIEKRWRNLKKVKFSGRSVSVKSYASQKYIKLSIKVNQSKLLIQRVPPAILYVFEMRMILFVVINHIKIYGFRYYYLLLG